MRLIVGLGNPGEKYKNTRHNIGFMVLDRLVGELGVTGFELNNKFACYMLQTTNCILAKPNTFMNDSGHAVVALTTFYHLQTTNLWVIHDDLDLRLGDYKIQFGVGPKLHYGIESVNKALGTRQYWRVRVGVDNRSSDNRIPGEDYVLQRFSDEEIPTLAGVINEVISDLTARLNEEEKS